MKINEILIKNFRCFEELNIKFDSKMNLIIGDNSSGKTALLEAISALASSFLIGFDDQNYFHINKRDIRVTRTLINHSIDEQFQLPLQICCSGTILNSNYLLDEWKLVNSTSNGKTSHIYIKKIINQTKEIQEKLRNSDTSFILPLVSYYSTARLWVNKEQRRSKYSRLFNRQNGYLDCVSPATDSKKMFEWIKKETIKKIQQSSVSPSLSTVMNAIRQGIENQASKPIDEVWYNIYTDELEITFSDGQTLPYVFFGDGYKVVMGLIADIAYRMSILNPQLDKDILTQTDGVVLIDEIDLHLHPKWQSEILDTLVRIFPKVQFIVTSHSPSVINSVKNKNLIMLKNFKGYNNYSKDNEVYGNDANTILETIMDAKSRPRIVHQLFENFYSNLDKSNYNVCEDLLNDIESKIGSRDSELNSCRCALQFQKS